jgi:hypothetical protein
VRLPLEERVRSCSLSSENFGFQLPVYNKLLDANIQAIYIYSVDICQGTIHFVTNALLSTRLKGKDLIGLPAALLPGRYRTRRYELGRLHLIGGSPGGDFRPSYNRDTAAKTSISHGTGNEITNRALKGFHWL